MLDYPHFISKETQQLQNLAQEILITFAWLFRLIYSFAAGTFISRECRSSGQIMKARSIWEVDIYYWTTIFLITKKTPERFANGRTKQQKLLLASICIVEMTKAILINFCWKATLSQCLVFCSIFYLFRVL